MTGTFYGPWRLMTTPVAFGNRWAVRVDNADGMYQADSAQPWDLDVHGADGRWNLSTSTGAGNGSQPPR